MTKRRVTQHNSRGHKDGRKFSSKHDDRQFDVTKSDHIDASKSVNNRYWTWCKDATFDTFEDAERAYYEENFREYLNARNEKSIRAGHRDRVQTMDDYRASKKSCVERQILQVGKKGKSVLPSTLEKIMMEQIAWEQETYPNCKILTAALHLDEATPHVHLTRVWVAHDAEGRAYVSQKDALEQMGVERPDVDRDTSRYNNPKMTYTANCRSHLEHLCQRYGIELEPERLERSKTGREIEDYKAEQAEARLHEAQAQLRQIQEEIDCADATLAMRRKGLKETNRKLEEARFEVEFERNRITSYIDAPSVLQRWYRAVRDTLVEMCPGLDFREFWRRVTDRVEHQTDAPQTQRHHRNRM